jgi:hypothetical protein
MDGHIILDKEAKIMRKEFQTENSISPLVIVGNNHSILLEDKIPDWIKEHPEKEQNTESCFYYKGNLYFLSEFMCINKNDKYFKSFDGYLSDSFFSGILIKLIDDDPDHIKAYWYYS